jgi:hypothetical protein
MIAARPCSRSNARDARARFSAAALLCALASACAGPTFQHGVYSSSTTTYRVGALGPEWEPMQVSDNDLAFHRAGLGTISVNSTCEDYEDVPSTALLNHLLFETTDRHYLIEETVTLDGRGARHALLRAELDGVPLELELFVLKKDGCVFDIAHIRRPDATAEGRANFLNFVQHFAVLEVKR